MFTTHFVERSMASGKIIIKIVILWKSVDKSGDCV